jgi:hypothetical protein
VPHFVERLGDVQEGRRAQCAVLKTFHNLIDYSMRLLYRGMARSKAKLVIGNEAGKVHIGLESLQEEFLKDLRRNREYAIWAIGSDFMSRLTRFRTIMICANFHRSV